MQRLEPAFDTIKQWSPEPLNVLQTDTEALAKNVAQQSSELNFRLIELLELYNVQSRLAEDLQAAQERITRLEQTVSELTSKNTEISSRERDREVLSQQHASTLAEMEMLTNRLNAMQAALDAEKANTASALAQVDHLRSELATATAERFKLVAMAYGRKRTSV